VVLALHWKVDNYESAEEVPCFSETQKLDYPLHRVSLLHTNVKFWNSVLYSHSLLLLTSVLILSSHQSFDLPDGLSLIGFSTKIQSSILLCTCTAQPIFINVIALITLNWGRAQIITLMLCNFLHRRATFSFVQIFLSACNSSTPSVQSALPSWWGLSTVYLTFTVRLCSLSKAKQWL